MRKTRHKSKCIRKSFSIPEDWVEWLEQTAERLDMSSTSELLQMIIKRAMREQAKIDRLRARAEWEEKK